MPTSTGRPRRRPDQDRNTAKVTETGTSLENDHDKHGYHEHPGTWPEATVPWCTIRRARVSGRSRSHCRPGAGAASGKCQAGAGATVSMMNRARTHATVRSWWARSGHDSRSADWPERSAAAHQDFRGGDDGIRTHDPLLAKQVLCQTELRPLACRFPRSTLTGHFGPAIPPSVVSRCVPTGPRPWGKQTAGEDSAETTSGRW